MHAISVVAELLALAGYLCTLANISTNTLAITGNVKKFYAGTNFYYTQNIHIEYKS